jgi:hypothetical protein
MRHFGFKLRLDFGAEHGFFGKLLNNKVYMKFPRIHSGVIWLVMIGACAHLAGQPVPPVAANPAPAIVAGNATLPTPVIASNATPEAPLIAGDAMIDFDNKQYDFGTSWAGAPVKHEFIVANSGTGTLVITNIHPACGCTTAGIRSLRVDPGKTGIIPVSFDNSHYSGNVSKTIDVYSNAKNLPRAILMLRGSVKKPIEVTPQSAVINIQSDSTNAATASVRIVNQSGSDVTISDPISSNKSFTGELKTVKPGLEYELIITAQPPFATAHTTAAFSLKTTLASVPTLSVTAIAAVQQAVEVSPVHITLTPPVPRWTTNRVFIHGNGSAPLTLEDPQSSDSRLQLQIVPLGTRNMFNLLVAVPPDFEIPRGQRVEVTVKSNHPHYPLITIPIGQLPQGRAAGGPSPIPPLVKQTSTNGAVPAAPHP